MGEMDGMDERDEMGTVEWNGILWETDDMAYEGHKRSYGNTCYSLNQPIVRWVELIVIGVTI
jgi:hypothetical protein